MGHVKLFRALSLGSLVGCGITQVELAPLAPDELLVVGSVPDRVIERFTHEQGGVLDESRLSLRYPNDGSAVPADLAFMRFVWEGAPAMPSPKPMPKAKDDGPEASEGMFYELCLEASAHTLCFYTDRTELDVGDKHWRGLAGSGSGDIAVRLRGLRGVEPLLAAPVTTLRTLAASASSTIYYANLALGTMQRGHLSSTFPEEASLSSPWAAACSTISRDGTRLVHMPSEHELQLVSLPTLDVLWTLATPFADASCAGLSFDPTARRIAFASAGRLALIDAETSALLTSTDESFPRVSHPDWSSDGRFLAVTLWPSDAMPDEMALQGTSLGRIPVSVDGALETSELLLAPSKKDQTLAFPSYSRDGGWLAYVQVKGKLRDGKEATLWLLPAAGGTPVALQRSASDPPKAEASVQLAAPAWLPSSDPTLEWLVFSSARASSLTAPAMGRQQLWITPVDKSLAAQGMDPSGPAVWIPFQAADSSNARPMIATGSNH